MWLHGAPNPKESPHSILLHAEEDGHLKVMDALLERDANIDARTKGACGFKCH